MLDLFGDFWIDSLVNVNFELGFDCNNECGGDYIVDCTNECLPNGQNLLTAFCNEFYYDVSGNLIEVDCESFSTDAQEFCCSQENIDCNDTCFGDFVEDLDATCCESEFVGCDGICGNPDNLPTAVDACGICDGGNYYDEFGELVGPNIDCEGTCEGSAELDACGICNGLNIDLGNGFITGPDADCSGECYGDSIIDCAGICNGNAIVETFYLDNDGDGLGSMESMNYCNVNVSEMSIPSVSAMSASVATKLNTLEADIIALAIALG